MPLSIPCVLLLLVGCARSHAPDADDAADDGTDSTDDDGGDSDGSDDGDGDDCPPAGIGECPSNEPRAGAACLVRPAGECFYLVEGCQRYYECLECRWEVTRTLGCGD